MDSFHLISEGWTRVPPHLMGNYEDTGKTDTFLATGNGFYKRDPKGTKGKVVERKQSR